MEETFLKTTFLDGLDNLLPMQSWQMNANEGWGVGIPY